MAALLACIATWISMTAFILSWTISVGEGPMDSLSSVLSIILLFDVVVCESSHILLLHVYVTDRLRPLLRDIYSVLCAAYALKLRKDYTPVNHVRVLQHLSPSCRAARSPSLSYLASAGLLSILEDRDVLRCCMRRDDIDIGIVEKAVLFIPSLLNWCDVIVQAGVLDMIMILCWCSFILFQVLLLKTSIALFVLFWICFVVMVLLRLFPKATSDEKRYVPIVTGIYSFCQYSFFHLQSWVGWEFIEVATVHKEWKDVNMLHFKDCNGIFRSDLVSVNSADPSVVAELPTEIADMMVVTSSAWESKQAWQWVQSFISQVYRSCSILGPSDFVRLSHHEVICDTDLLTDFETVGLLVEVDDYTDNDEEFRYNPSLDSFDYDDEYEVRVSPNSTPPARRNSRVKRLNSDDVTYGSDISGALIPEKRNVGNNPVLHKEERHVLDDSTSGSGTILSRNSAQSTNVKFTSARLTSRSHSSGSSGQSENGGKSDKSRNHSGSGRRGSRSRSSGGSCTSRRSGRDSRSRSKISLEMSSSTKYSSERAQDSSEQKLVNSRTPSSSDSVPSLQYGLIHAAFVSRSVTDEKGQHVLPMSSLVEFASGVLQSPSMLKSTREDREGFVLSSIEVNDAVQPLVLFASSPEQAHLSIEYSTFTTWLEKTMTEVVDKRKVFHLSKTPSTVVNNISNGSSPKKSPQQSPNVLQKVESPSGDKKMIGMELTFQDDDDVSLLTNPMSVGSANKKLTKSQQANTRNWMHPSTTAGMKQHDSNGSSSSGSSGSSSSSSGSSATSHRSSTARDSLNSNDRGCFSIRSTYTSDSSVSNPPVVGKLGISKPVECEKVNFEKKVVRSGLGAVEEASQENSECSSIVVEQVPAKSGNGLHVKGEGKQSLDRKVSWGAVNFATNEAVYLHGQGSSSDALDYTSDDIALGSRKDLNNFIKDIRDNDDSSVDGIENRRRSLRKMSSLSSDCSEWSLNSDIVLGNQSGGDSDCNYKDDDVSLIDMTERPSTPSRISISKDDTHTAVSKSTFYF